MTIEQFSLLTGIGLLIAQMALIIGGLGIVISRRFRKRILSLTSQRNWTILALLMVIGSMGGSLIYSNIYHLPICPFCWYQRMALYPQVVILGVALWKKQYTGGLISSLILSIIALAVALYHYGLNIHTMLYPALIPPPCDASGISCADIPVRIFGYMTIPFMTIVVSVGIISIILLALNTSKK